MKSGIHVMPYNYYNLLHSVIPMWRLLEVRWNDDEAFTEDLLRMRITNLT